MPNVPEDLTGRTFGQWTVLALIPKNGHRRRFWLCRCECGVERNVAAGHLRGGRSKGCGCARNEATRARVKTHGKSSQPEYYAWYDAIARCHKSNHDSYNLYGLRGIYVCARWRESFECFYTDMGPKPTSSHSLDRIDNDGPYSPENCRWADSFTQQRNRRDNRFLTHSGETLTVAEWSERTGLNKETILYRLRAGWPVEKALTEPPHRRKPWWSRRA